MRTKKRARWGQVEQEIALGIHRSAPGLTSPLSSSSNHINTHSQPPPRDQTLTSNRWTAPSCSFLASTWAWETQGAVFQFTFIYFAVYFQFKTPMKGLHKQNGNTFSVIAAKVENDWKESNHLCRHNMRPQWRIETFQQFISFPGARYSHRRIWFPHHK